MNNELKLSARPIEELLDELDNQCKIEEHRKEYVLWRIYYAIKHAYWWVARIDLKYECKKIYWFFQRGYRGYGSNDVWGFGSYVAPIIAAGAKKIKDNAQGYPSRVGTEDMSTDEGMAEWKRVLGEIEWAFNAAHKVMDHDWVAVNEKTKRSIMKNMRKRSLDTMYFMTRAEQDRMDKGMKLFVKHIWDLWD